MPERKATQYRDKLLIEIVTEKLQFGRLSTALFGPDFYAPYLFVVVGLLVEYGFFDVYNYVVTGRSSFITSPNSLAIPAMTLLGVFGLRYIHDTYADAVVTLGVEDGNVGLTAEQRASFEGLVPLKLRLAVYAAVLVIYYAFITLVIGLPELIEISGIGLVLYAQLVSFPLIIIPTLVGLAIAYVAVHLSVPRRIKNADLDLFFYDPRNLGGFEPVGELLKRSYYIYTAVLLLWFLQTHTPVLLASVLESPYPPPGPVYQVALSAVWIVGVLTIGYSMYRIHGIMKSKKEQRIRALERELKQAVEDPYDVTVSNVADQERYERAQENLAHVQQTKTYPTTFTMWSQIFLSVLLPQALNMVVQLPQ